MLAQFTWQQFLVAAFVLSLVWYLAIFLLYYRNKASDFFSQKPKGKQPEKLRKEWEAELDEEPEVQEAEPDTMMGRPVEPEGVSTVAMGSLRFAERSPDKDTRSDDQLGLVPDVLEELKGVFNQLQNEDGSKADFFPLIRQIKEKYPMIAASDNLEEINRYIRDHVPFLLTDEELEDLWD